MKQKQSVLKWVEDSKQKISFSISYWHDRIKNVIGNSIALQVFKAMFLILSVPILIFSACYWGNSTTLQGEISATNFDKGTITIELPIGNYEIEAIEPLSIGNTVNLTFTFKGETKEIYKIYKLEVIENDET